MAMAMAMMITIIIFRFCVVQACKNCNQSMLDEERKKKKMERKERGYPSPKSDEARLSASNPPQSEST